MLNRPLEAGSLTEESSGHRLSSRASPSSLVNKRVPMKSRALKTRKFKNGSPVEFLKSKGARLPGRPYSTLRSPKQTPSQKKLRDIPKAKTPDINVNKKKTEFKKAPNVNRICKKQREQQQEEPKLRAKIRPRSAWGNGTVSPPNPIRRLKAKKPKKLKKLKKHTKTPRISEKPKHTLKPKTKKPRKLTVPSTFHAALFSSPALESDSSEEESPPSFPDSGIPQKHNAIRNKLDHLRIQIKQTKTLTRDSVPCVRTEAAVKIQRWVRRVLARAALHRAKSPHPEWRLRQCAKLAQLKETELQHIASALGPNAVAFKQLEKIVVKRYAQLEKLFNSTVSQALSEEPEEESLQESDQALASQSASFLRDSEHQEGNLDMEDAYGETSSDASVRVSDIECYSQENSLGQNDPMTSILDELQLLLPTQERTGLHTPELLSEPVGEQPGLVPGASIEISVQPSFPEFPPALDEELTGDHIIMSPEELTCPPVVRTDSNSVLEYIEDILTIVLHSEVSLQTLLLTPVCNDPLQYLSTLQGAESSPEDADGGILKIETYLQVEQHREERLKATIPPEFLHLALNTEHIHNKMIFDALNENLQTQRALGPKGPPPPWSTVCAVPKQRLDLQCVFSRLKEDIEECAQLQNGKIMSSSWGIDSKLVRQLHEESLSHMLALDVVDQEPLWVDYELEATQTAVALGELVLAQLLRETLTVLSI